MAAIPNKKRLFISNTLSASAWAVLKSREDIEAIAFPAPLTGPEFVKLISTGGETHGAILGGTRFGEAECEGAKGLQVVARIGVGYDAIDIPALNKRKVPLMTTGIANSPSVAGYRARGCAELDRNERFQASVRAALDYETLTLHMQIR